MSSGLLSRAARNADAMRPPARPQSALRYPLNHLLGTEASVRVLRVLFSSDVPIGLSELARRAELQPSGVARVCARLEDLGVIEAVGHGERNRQYRRTATFPLGGSLAELFRQESQRAAQVTHDLQAAVRGASGVRAAWIEGPVARGSDAPGDPVIVSILADSATADQARVQIRERLLPIQAHHGVEVELQVLTNADLRTADRRRLADLEPARPLLGPSPLELIGGSRPERSVARARKKRHEHVDLRSRELAKLIADRIARDPALVEDAKRYVERRLQSASPGERLELQEWNHVLSTMSVPRLRRFLIEDGPRATRLRQSTPFLNVLSDSDRRAIFDAAAKKR
jgi:DNA-binding MarR family transcriptional regulator